MSQSNVANVAQSSKPPPHRHLPLLSLHHLAAAGLVRLALLVRELKVHEPVLEDGLADGFEGGVHAAAEGDFWSNEF